MIARTATSTGVLVSTRATVHKRKDIMRPQIQATEFGSIVIEVEQIRHDVVIGLAGTIKAKEGAVEETVWHLPPDLPRRGPAYL